MAHELYNAVYALVDDFLGPLKNGKQFTMVEAVVTMWNGKSGKATVIGGGEVSFTGSNLLPILSGKAVVLAPIQRAKSVSQTDQSSFYYVVGVS